MLALLAAVVLTDPAVIAKGGAIFAQSCGIGYCHGKAGAANRGPRLAGRKFDKDYLFQVISEGAGNGAMPGFARQYSADDRWALVAYILSLAAPATGQPATASPEIPASGAEKDPFAAGRAVFQERCVVCHAWRGRGGEVGPDLAAQAGRDPREILRDIVDPGARLALQPVAVVLKSGERVTGVKKQETAELIRIWDTSSLPPVLRTLYKDQIQSVTPETASAMPDGFGRTLTGQQLRDLVDFLRSSP